MNLLFSTHRKDLILMLLLILLIIALPLTLYLAKQSQDIRPRAKTALGPAKLFLAAPSLTNLEVSQGQTFTVDLYLDPADKNVSGVEAHLTYPANMLDVIGTAQINTTKFPTIIKNTAGNGAIDIAVGAAL